ncbi:MAG: DUF308 domain-containing protein, partial [Lachnospiraceae bacterium]|nr:DUF308 domain-containing protein [Lachnospiraceae bacterium]
MKTMVEKAKYPLAGIGELFLGIVLMIRPDGFIRSVITGLGIVLIVLGLIHMVSWFRTEPKMAKRERRLSKGLLVLAVGTCCILGVDWIMNRDFMPQLLYGILFFAMGAVKVQWTADFIRSGKHQWVLSGISVAVSFVAAALIWLNPAWYADIAGTLIPFIWIAVAVLDVLSVFYKGNLFEYQKIVRKKESLGSGNWKFQKDCSQLPKRFPSKWESVTLPHTWNASDGQDGGNDYFRGKCAYALRIPRQRKGGRVWLEIEAASMVADVYINGKEVTHHEGSYSAFRVDVTDYLAKRKNLLCILVDNANHDGVYPQMADFTFFGGLYRNVSLITVPESHFAMDHFGADGFLCTPISDEIDTRIRTEAWLENGMEQDIVYFSAKDREGVVVAQSEVTASEYVSAELHIPQPHFWQGVDDPYLYTVSAKLLRNGEVIDELSVQTGIRTFTVYPEKGFFLNGKQTSLRGVARHQDRENKGYAISEQDQMEDAALIREIGANTVRLAHYQHSQAFYSECDRLGLVVWAEIPLISAMSDHQSAHENSLQQMKELVSQNYNHPSI